MSDAFDAELSKLSNGDHCCLLFSSPEEQIRLTAPFLYAGFRRGERCVFVGSDDEVERMREGLKAQRVEWMTSQLVRVRTAEAARERALDELMKAHEQLKRMEKVRDIFGLFVTPEVVDHVLPQPPSEWRRGEQKTVTVLFADVSQFTPFVGEEDRDGLLLA